MTLVILAAGMGSRYGGLKQIDPITENGEFIIDFSVYDALVNHFDKIVFVIKEENLSVFRDTIGHRFEDRVRVEYVFQKPDDLPEGFSVPAGRVKPWGTAHALLAARSAVHEPFAVINADDFYGNGAYRLLYTHFADAEKKDDGMAHYCMVGYRLGNTLTENGTVSRGICRVNDDGYLTEVVERTGIRRVEDTAVFADGEKSVPVSLDATASMNCWGFTPDIFDKVAEGFRCFLEAPGTNLVKGEYYLPFAVCELMESGRCDVKVYRSEDAWYGVTYLADKDSVTASIRALREQGRYPGKLTR